MRTNYCVYMHTSPSGKVYIGITGRNPLDRWLEGRGYKKNEHFFSAILKYGWDNIKHEILFSGLTEEEACAKETELISLYHSNDRRYGYNNTSGGEHYTHSEESKQKMRYVQSRRSPEIAKKISAAKMGHFVSEETRQKLSKAHTGRKHGRAPSANTLAAHRKAVLCVETGERFVSGKEAHRLVGVSRGNLSECLRGRRQTAGGYHWKYLEEDENGST